MMSSKREAARRAMVGCLGLMVWMYAMPAVPAGERMGAAATDTAHETTHATPAGQVVDTAGEGAASQAAGEAPQAVAGSKADANDTAGGGVAEDADSMQTEATTGEVRPGFDMDVLIDRLKNSDAIGVFTKLALRSDAMDIIDAVKKYRQQDGHGALSQIRAQFDGLLLKVLALLDKDPQLSSDISMAREDIWNSLLEVKA